jgi:hypothetical protein
MFDKPLLDVWLQPKMKPPLNVLPQHKMKPSPHRVAATLDEAFYHHGAATLDEASTGSTLTDVSNVATDARMFATQTLVAAARSSAGLDICNICTVALPPSPLMMYASVAVVAVASRQLPYLRPLPTLPQARCGRTQLPIPPV